VGVGFHERANPGPNQQHHTAQASSPSTPPPPPANSGRGELVAARGRGRRARARGRRPRGDARVGRESSGWRPSQRKETPWPPVNSLPACGELAWGGVLSQLGADRAQGRRARGSAGARGRVSSGRGAPGRSHLRQSREERMEGREAPAARWGGRGRVRWGAVVWSMPGERSHIQSSTAICLRARGPQSATKRTPSAFRSLAHDQAYSLG
jgi:hypothetical protein